MASIPGSVRFAGFIAPTDSTDTFPVFKPIYGLGGLRTVASISERNAITTQRRENGMIVYVTADTIYYKLESGLTNSDWTVFNSGSGSGSFLPLSGGTVTGNALFSSSLSANNFNATVITGGTFISGSTNLYNIFAPLGVTSGSYNQPGSNISTGGTANNQTISLVASPQINNLYASGITSGTSIIGNTLSGGTIYSGSSDLSTVFMPINANFITGNGTANYLPLWLGAGSLTISSLYQDPVTGISIFNNVEITGDLTVLGTAYTTNTSIVQSFDNLIILNYSGNHLSAIGGGLMVQSGQTSGSPSLWIIDNFGNWSANTQIIAGGGLNINTGTTLSSGGTNLYSIFSTIAQSGGTSASLWSASTGVNSIRANNGTANEAGGYTSIVAGQSNNTGGNYSSIIGGSNNIISNSGTHSVISGGLSNKVVGSKSIIVGGSLNTALTYYSTVVGGKQNTISGNSYSNNTSASFIGGGINNIALDGAYGSSSVVVGGKNNFAGGNYYSFSVVVGGNRNSAAGGYSAVLGGNYNRAAGYKATIVGGAQNLAVGPLSFIGGGIGNYVSGQFTFVGGGKGNSTSSDYAAVAGGKQNTASGPNSFIGGGQNNTSSGNYANIGGGLQNTASGNFSIIIGGKNNTSSGAYSFLGGGLQNVASGNYSVVVGGGNTYNPTLFRNRATGTASVVVGGQRNYASAQHASVLGGLANSATTSYASIVGGTYNKAFGTKSFVGGGNNNIAQGSHSTIVGGSANQTTGNFSFIGNGALSVASGYRSFIANGAFNTASGIASAIVGGTNHFAIGDNTVVIGGSAITGTSSNTVYIPNARLAEMPGSVIYSAGTDLYQIFGTGGGGTQKYALSTGFTANIPKYIDHNLGLASSTDALVQMWSGNSMTLGADISAVTVNQIAVTVGVTGTYKIVVIG